MASRVLFVSGLELLKLRVIIRQLDDDIRAELGVLDEVLKDGDGVAVEDYILPLWRVATGKHILCAGR